MTLSHTTTVILNLEVLDILESVFQMSIKHREDLKNWELSSLKNLMLET